MSLWYVTPILLIPNPFIVGYVWREGPLYDVEPVLLALFSVLAIFSQQKTRYMDPGYVPIDPKLITGDTKKKKQKCEKCTAIKVDRAHHCSQCKRCVVGMSHHCPWIDNCVGIRNTKMFINYLFYTSVAATYTIVIFYRSIPYWMYWYKLHGEERYREILFGTAWAFLAFIFVNFTLMMMGQQTAEIISGKTMIDTYTDTEAREMSMPNKLRIAMGSPYFSLQWFNPFVDVKHLPSDIGFNDVSLTAVSKSGKS